MQYRKRCSFVHRYMHTYVHDTRNKQLQDIFVYQDIRGLPIRYLKRGRAIRLSTRTTGEGEGSEVGGGGDS